MNVYHRQKQFRSQHARWAKDLKELGIEGDEISLRLVGDEYLASGKLVSDETPAEVWHVRPDSRLWRSDNQALVEAALDKAGKNAAQLRQALDQVTARQREGMEFLIAHMPQVDLESLTAEFLVNNVREAYETLDAALGARRYPKRFFSITSCLREHQRTSRQLAQRLS